MGRRDSGHGAALGIGRSVEMPVVPLWLLPPAQETCTSRSWVPPHPPHHGAASPRAWDLGSGGAVDARGRAGQRRQMGWILEPAPPRTMCQHGARSSPSQNEVRGSLPAPPPPPRSPSPPEILLPHL